MNPTIIDVPYDPLMVLMSFLVSAVGAYVALAATAQARSRGTISRASMFSIGLALGGVGIWAAHFLGMIALRIPIGNGYAMGETLLSLVAASVAIAIVTATTALMGAAVCAMPYTGMAAATVCSTPTQALAWGDWVLRPGELPSFVVVLAVLVLAVLVLDVLVLLLVSMNTMLRTLQPAAKPRNPA